MERAGVPLVEYVNWRIYYGIKTGFNEAFYIDGETRRAILSEQPGAKEVIKRLIVGDDVRKWRVTPTDRWLLYMDRGVEAKAYPAVIRHLRPHRDRLEHRATNQEWHELQQPQSKYAVQFSKAKILFPDIAKESRFTIDTSGAYINDTVFAIGVSDLYLLGVLNSTHAWTYLMHTAAVLGDAQKGGRLRLKYNYMGKVPIPEGTEKDRARIAGLVEKCLAAKGDDCGACEQEIDVLVEALYRLC